jgi:hypothetical protein
MAADGYGDGRAGQVVVGGRWVDVAAAAGSVPPVEWTHHLAAGWGTATRCEVEPLGVAEARNLGRLAAALGPEAWAELPADLQLAYLRDIYGNPAGCGWSTKGKSAAAAEQYVFEKTLAVMRSCCTWRASIGAATMPDRPLPREDVFRRAAVHEVTGTDAWGHPILWATATGWPCIDGEVRANFSGAEMLELHTKRFLELQWIKREISAERQRPVSLHCAVLAFQPQSTLKIANARWLSKSLEYDGLTTDQWFFPFTLNSPALIVNTPWAYRALMKVAKTFMVEETANKFKVVGSDFMPLLRQQGTAYGDIPAWIRELAAPHTPW